MARLRYKRIVEVYNEFLEIGNTRHLDNRDWRKPGNEERLEAKKTREIRQAVKTYNTFSDAERRFFRDWSIRNPGFVDEVNRECKKRGIDFELKY